MKPGHVATSAVDYLARKKGLVLNSADISNTIIANVDAAEHRGVVVPPGTPEGYLLTVDENNKSVWKISEADVLLTSPNIWTVQQEFKTPPIVSYEYANLTETSNQVVTTQVAHTIVNNKFQTITLASVLNENPVGLNGQQLTLTDSTSTATFSSSQIIFTDSSGVPIGPVDPGIPIGPVDPGIPIGPVDPGIPINPDGPVPVDPSFPSVPAGNGNKNIRRDIIIGPVDPGIPVKITSYSNHAIVSNDLYTISSTQGINIEGQVTFDRPPRAPKPVIGNDVATKSYVDTLVGNYSGNGINLYMNEGQLSPALTTGSQLIETIVSEDTLIAEFITDNNYFNTTSIPSGLWSMTLYGKISDDTIDTRYYFEIYKVSGTTYTLLTTSMLSEYINTISSIPDAYHINVPFIDTVSLTIMDRLAVRLYATSSSAVTVTTYFGGIYYSFISTSITGDVSIVSMNNIFSGENTFESQIKATGGITTSALYGTTLKLTTLESDTVQANYATITGLITANNINVTELIANEISTTGITVTGAIYAESGLNVVGLTATGISATNLRVTNLQVTNIHVDELVYAGEVIIDGITSTGISTTNLRTTNLYVDTLNTTNTTVNELSCQLINASVNTDPVSLYISSQDITLGSPLSTVKVSNITIKDTSIESSVPTSGTITIGASQTSGILNIGTSTIRSGEINLGGNGCTININGTPTVNYLLTASNGITSTSIYTNTLTVGDPFAINTLNVTYTATCSQLIISSIPSDILAVGYREILNLGTITFNTGTSAKTAYTFSSGAIGGRKGVWIYEISFTYTTSGSTITTSFSKNTAMDATNSVAYTVVANSANTYVNTMSLSNDMIVRLIYTNSSSSIAIVSNPTTFIATRIA